MLKDKRWAYVLWTFRRKKDEILAVAEQRAGMFPAGGVGAVACLQGSGLAQALGRDTLGPHCQDQAVWKGSNRGEGGHAGDFAIAPSVVTPGLAPWTSGSPACLPRSQFPRCRPETRFVYGLRKVFQETSVGTRGGGRGREGRITRGPWKRPTGPL